MPTLLSPELKGRIKAYVQDCGFSVSAAARYYNVSRNSVNAILNNVRRTDMDKKRNARRRKKKTRAAAINARRRDVWRLAEQTVLQHYTEGKRQRAAVRRVPKYPSAQSIKYWFNANRPGNSPSVSTINRDLHGGQFFNRVRPIVPYKEACVKRRFRFCSNENFYRASYVKRIIFSDEHYVTSNDYSCRTQWIRDKRNLLPRSFLRKDNVVSAQLWGAVGFNYKSKLVWVEFEDDSGTKKRLNNELYCEHMIKPHINDLCSKNRIFMQDGARAHQAKDTLKFLQRHKINYIADWPANSPDLNPIEQMWAYINRRLSHERAPASNPGELKAMIERIWDEIPQKVINNHVMSFMTKVAACKRNNGGLSR